MKKVFLKNSIEGVWVKATGFPHGVEEAHNKLRSLVGHAGELTFYGLSHPSPTGEINYWAGASNAGNGKAIAGTESFPIRSAAYLSKIVDGWKENLVQVSDAFSELIGQAGVAPDGFCLEEYLDENTVRCLVPLAEPLNTQEREHELATDISHTFGRLSHIVARFDDETFNQLPFEGSWTAGQAAEHILICSAGVPDIRTVPAGRFADQKVYLISKMFLDMNLKFRTAPELEPRGSSHRREEILEAIAGRAAMLRDAARAGELDLLCLDMELPAFGLLTRYEWIRFILVHTQRHTLQIERIYQHLGIARH